MTRSLLVLPAVALVALLAGAGCESQVDASSSPTLEHESLALRDPAVFPPRVDLPIGTTKQQVCSHDDGDMKKAFADYAAAQKKTINLHPPSDITKWAMEGDYVYTCRFCDLDGMKISVPQSMKIRIEDSSARDLQIYGMELGSTVHMKNVYARGLKIYKGVSIDFENVDARCGYAASAMFNTYFVWAAKNVDMAGTDANWRFRGPVSDLRLTGAASSVEFDDTTLANARFDGATSQYITLDHVKMSGDIRFDRANGVTVDAKDTTFTGGSVHSPGAHGVLQLSGQTTFDGVDLSDNDGGLSIDLTYGVPGIRAIHGTKWPVGKNHLLDDTKLGALDFGAPPATAEKGAMLVTTNGETWPTSKLDLTGLRLTHGALPVGADLTKVVLDKAQLERVDMSSAVLTGTSGHASLQHANLQRADFGGTKLDGVDFTNADLRGASFTSASGTAIFTAATAGVLPAKVGDNDTGNPLPTTFAHAVLGESRFDHAQLQSANLSLATLTDVHFDGATLDFAKMNGARFHRGATDSGISNTTLAKAASIHAASFDGADLRGVDLSGLDFSSSSAMRSSFVGAYLCGATLKGTKLNDADLSTMYFDVDGTIDLPDEAKGPCKPGDRTGADTRSVVSTIGTKCPLGGHAPAGGDGACTDAQWKLQGQSSCTAEQTANALDDGAPCTIDCDCQSLFCDVAGSVGPKGTCQEKP